MTDGSLWHVRYANRLFAMRDLEEQVAAVLTANGRIVAAT